MNYRRIFFALGFVLIVIALAGLLYYLIFRQLGIGNPPAVVGPGTLPNVNQGQIPVVNTNGNGVTTLPFGAGDQIDQVASGRGTVVTDYQGVTVADGKMAGDNLMFYDASTGHFNAMDASGSVTPLVSEVFNDVSNVVWAPNRTQAILEYPDGSNIFYDFNKKQQITLPKELDKFAIDPSGTQLSAIWNGADQDSMWLMTGKIDGSDLKIVQPIGDKKLDVNVGISPDNQVVALYRQASDSGKQEVYPIGRNGENLRSFVVDGLKFESSWSPGGNYLLYDATSGKDDWTPRLWLTEGNTNDLGYSQTDLQLNTWASKCSFNNSSTSLYCAVPVELPQGAGLYPSLADNTPDVFFRIDIASGNKVPLAVPVGSQGSYSAKSVFLSPDESILYFVDNVTGKLHSIRLK